MTIQPISFKNTDAEVKTARINPGINTQFNIKKCFPTDMATLAFGKIQKAFVKPSVYKFGQNFKNKSEENRFGKVAQHIVKLKHLLTNDPERSHFYILNFLL